MAYKQSGWSAFTQKSKSGKKDEDRNITLSEVAASKKKKAEKNYQTQFSQIDSDTSLSGNQKKSKQDKVFNQVNEDLKRGTQFSSDSISKKGSADLDKHYANFDWDNKSQDQYDKEVEEGHKKGRWWVR